MMRRKRNTKHVKQVHELELKVESLLVTIDTERSELDLGEDAPDNNPKTPCVYYTRPIYTGLVHKQVVVAELLF